MIPHNLLQKTKDPIPGYVKDQMKNWLPVDWKHIIFTGDDDAIRYLETNKTNDYPNIVDKFHSFKNGAHKADLFRIFWLWQNGGIYLDSDVMLAVPITRLIRTNTQFITTSSQKECSVGFLGCTAFHPIMGDMLDLLYDLDPAVLQQDYFFLCKQLYKFLLHSKLQGVRIYIEIVDDAKGIAEICDSKAVAFHYYKYKIIPE